MRKVNFPSRCSAKRLLEGFPTLLGDDILNHLWFPWPVGTAAALLGPPPASGEILIHRSHGCSSNPPADAPSLLPRQPATCLLWHACVSVCLTQSVHSSVHLSVKRLKPEASVIKMHTCFYLKGQYVSCFPPYRTYRVLEIISKIRKKRFMEGNMFPWII